MLYDKAADQQPRSMTAWIRVLILQPMYVDTCEKVNYEYAQHRLHQFADMWTHQGTALHSL